MASIQIRNLSKSYGDVEVIPGVSFDIEDGEFVVLVGPSGCGKSTLLRMIAGLEDITSGDLLIDGKRVNDVAAKERDIAMVFQSYALYPHMSVEKNMGFSLRIAGRPKQEIKERVAEVAEILDLTALLNRKPGQLSGGQRQRVAMGRAIVRDPSVFLFDEPLSNLDAQLRVQMRTEISAMHTKFPTTTVYVTHDQIEAMTMADRIVVLRAGKVEQIGKPLDLYDAPDNLFVARFIGSPQINLIDGTIEVNATGVHFVSGKLSMPAPERMSAHAGKGIAIGIRPQDLFVVEAETEGAIETSVGLVEPMGAETLVSMTLDGHPAQGLFKERIELDSNRKLHISFDANKAHFFDLKSEKRL